MGLGLSLVTQFTFGSRRRARFHWRSFGKVGGLSHPVEEMLDESSVIAGGAGLLSFHERGHQMVAFFSENFLI
jgi:hypothetical protein